MTGIANRCSPQAIRPHGAVAAVLALALLATGCTSTDQTDGTQLRTAQRAAEFVVGQGIEQIAITRAQPDINLGLFDRSKRRVATQRTDRQGSALFRSVPPGAGYRVQQLTTGPAPTSDPIRVRALADSTPDQTFYDQQRLQPGFQYITTRDGTTLSAAVYLPGPADRGPYPTVVEYSGYSPSNPTGDLMSIFGARVNDDGTCSTATFVCTTPDQPSSLLALALGYAVVAVNMRGTGCSGGAYDFFEPLQLTDGYDVIETVAAQPWVRNGRVGMVGLSYPGIAQLFVASVQPPHLAAITPLSVFDDAYRGLLSPGGIFNKGFALAWADEVLKEAEPFGQSWTQDVVDQRHDEHCADNQLLRLQNINLSKEAEAHPFYVPRLADRLDVNQFADRIKVPVFLACAFQDEQTGGRCARLSERFTNSPVHRVTLYNGAHSDGYLPEVLVEWKAFLDIYVAGELTPIAAEIRALAPTLMEVFTGSSAPIPPERWLNYPSFDDAKTAYEAELPVRVIYENGGRSEAPGSPQGRFEQRYSAFPPEDVSTRTWFLNGTSLRSDPPTAEGAQRFAVNRELGDRTTLPNQARSAAFEPLPKYRWLPDSPGDAAVYESDPLAETETYAGTGNARLWIRSTSTEADLEVTLSEVRPDGQEVYVQSGWLRASHRALASNATELDPVISDLRSDAAPLVPGRWTQVQILLFPFAHVFRAGSRLRISVHTPGGTRPFWSWILARQPADTKVDIGQGPDRQSSIMLPLSATPAGTTASLPACPGLRGQPCRPATDYDNAELTS